MHEPQDGEGFLDNTGKAEPNLVEAACMLLANKLYTDYMDSFCNFRRRQPEAESFAENWMKERVPDGNQVMTQSVWRQFLHILIERRGNE